MTKFNHSGARVRQLQRLLLSHSLTLTKSYERFSISLGSIPNCAKPAELPVERPKRFELMINLKAAKQIGLTIPTSVLVLADKVIK